MFSFGFQDSLPDMNQSQCKAWSEGAPEPAATPSSGTFLSSRSFCGSCEGQQWHLNANCSSNDFF